MRGEGLLEFQEIRPFLWSPMNTRGTDEDDAARCYGNNNQGQGLGETGGHEQGRMDR